ncbi:zinc transporter foi [Dendroctonus ponderosae]|uniref:zinc transporter foi n=1 Tax=Dendroctonus ponderosae TaxID=77166 RepID=UPI002035E205|nr:zinc transporter foi [Dendroctonus ponderosae]
MVHLLSVCIFCLICATHTPCGSHAAVSNLGEYRHDGYKDPNILQREHHEQLTLRAKRHNEERSDITNIDPSTKRDSDFLKKIFLKFGDGDKMSIEGLERLLKKLDLLQVVTERIEAHDKEDHHKTLDVDVKKQPRQIENNGSCFNTERIAVLQQRTEKQPLNQTAFSEACPLLIYSLLTEKCSTIEKATLEISTPEPRGNYARNWLFSILAVVVISVCGLGALVIIPMMQKKFYKPLLQFLVALAVGTLAGDALLHLLPHAMSEVHSHGAEHHYDPDGPDPHTSNTWKGLAAMMGLTLFFIMERLIMVAAKYRKKKQKDSSVSHAHVQVYNDEGERRNSTQCMDKYNTYPYCYNDIMTDPNDKSEPKMETNQNMLDGDLILTPCIETKMLPREHEDYTVIVREHEIDHHGHSHKHGHVHAAPQNYSSVAWMVIMGDGLHNFTDGMAIGAAFASGIGGGVSTTVAVFCHELPHELGDFALLLKAGMTMKQAMYYNILSSILCIFGNFVGLILGNTEVANQWVFAVAAGTFIYIALVDMMPELSSAHEDEENLFQYFLHLSGLLMGIGIMTAIALCENDLKTLFDDS